MEIRIVGWHLVDAPDTCNDCGAKAAYVVAYEMDEGYTDSFNLCQPCSVSSRYTVTEDEIDKIFRDYGI